MRVRFPSVGVCTRIVAALLCIMTIEAAHGAATPAPQPSNAISLPRAKVILPAGWERQTPTSAMRAAQAVIPGAGGPGELTIFFFGEGQGGGVDANIARWTSQVDPGPRGVPTRQSFTVGPFKITWVELAGTLKPGTMGMGPSAPQPNTRVLGAVVEGPGGPWFFRATGPDKTIAAQREAFLGMLRSIEAN